MMPSSTVNVAMPANRSLVPRIPSGRLVRAVIAAAALALRLGSPSAALRAQTPYAPVTSAPGQVTLSLDMQAHAARAARNGWVWGLPGVSVGLPGRVTAGARLSLFEPLGQERLHDAIPQVSWLALDDTLRRVRIGVSALALVPVGGNARPRDAFGIVYGTAAWTAPRTGTTLVAGGYRKFDRSDALAETRQGVILEAAQPIPSPIDGVGLGLAASWFQGRNLFGYAIVSLQAQVGRWFVSAGWARGNEPRYNSGPALSLAVPW
jgi:hypothetical protein